MKDCKPLANQYSDQEPLTFICVGHLENEKVDRKFEENEYRLCVKSQEADEMDNLDKRDITDQAAVMMQALSVIENISYNKENNNAVYNEI